jgi:hypothetical protein
MLFVLFVLFGSSLAFTLLFVLTQLSRFHVARTHTSFSSWL